MIVSTMPGAKSPLSGASDFALDGTTVDLGEQLRVLRSWARPLTNLMRPRQATKSLRSIAHAVLVNDAGAWAWTPTDRFAPATCFAAVRDWMCAHPGASLRLLLSGESGAAFDIAGLTDEGERHGVRVLSVRPWWMHAFAEAKHCVPGLEQAATSRVCVVDGASIAWIVAERGEVARVHHRLLAEARVDALRHAMRTLHDEASTERIATVVLGQGLIDGNQTQAVNGLVLGRLDGAQPPQWLRPCTLNLH